jgi:hypothetical protein
MVTRRAVHAADRLLDYIAHLLEATRSTPGCLAPAPRRIELLPSPAPAPGWLRDHATPDDVQTLSPPASPTACARPGRASRAGARRRGPLALESVFCL